MNRRRFTIATMVVGLAATASQLSATLISRDFYTTGDGLLTYDPVNQREWLDVTQTEGVTPGEVAALVGSGGPFEGFRVARYDDVLSLLDTAGFDLLNVLGPQDYDLAAAFIRQLSGFEGAEGIFGDFRYTSGLIEDNFGGITGETFFVLAVGDEILPPGPINSVPVDLPVASINVSAFGLRTLGVWLYRDAAVPEPSTIGMFATALLLFVARQRRQSNRIHYDSVSM